MCNSSGCPETFSVDQIGLEITEIHLLLSTGFKGMHHHLAWAFVILDWAGGDRQITAGLNDQSI